MFWQNALLVVHHGKTHGYLGMAIDYAIPGKVCFSMEQFVENLLAKCPNAMTKH